MVVRLGSRAVRLATTFLLPSVVLGLSACGPATGRGGPTIASPTTAGRAPLASVSAGDSRVRLAEGRQTFHDVRGDVPCWSFATDGLAAFGQKELVFFVRSDAGLTVEHARNDLTLFAAGVVELASQGRLVDVGGHTEMGAGMLGRADFSGVLYTAPQPVSGLELEGGKAHTLKVKGGEARYAARLLEAR